MRPSPRSGDRLALETILAGVEKGLRLRGVRRRRLDLAPGRSLSYLESGRGRDGPTFVLVHGLGSSAFVWIKVLVRLGRTHHVVAPDLPGYGKSPLPQGRDHQTVDELVAGLGDLLGSAVTKGSVVLVGQSLGGWIAAKTARRFPERIGQLVLVNSAGILYPGIEDLQSLLRPTTRQEVYAFWARMWYRVPRYYRPFWRSSAANLTTPAVRGFLASLRKQDFINEDLPRLSMPVSILWGRADRFIPPANVDLLVEALGSTRVHWIAKCGHIPAMEAPGEVTRHLEGLARARPEDLPTPPAVARPPTFAP